MGLVRGGAASSRVSAEPKLLWPVPEHWSLEDAATVPLAYAHAFYCLVSVLLFNRYQKRRFSMDIIWMVFFTLFFLLPSFTI